MHACYKNITNTYKLESKKVLSHTKIIDKHTSELYRIETIKQRVKSPQGRVTKIRPRGEHCIRPAYVHSRVHATCPQTLLKKQYKWLDVGRYVVFALKSLIGQKIIIDVTLLGFPDSNHDDVIENVVSTKHFNSLLMSFVCKAFNFFLIH